MAKYGLTFEAWLYHPQLDDLADLLGKHPDNKVVLDHLGGPLGAGFYETRRAEVFADWAAKIKSLARFPNLFVKLGGLAMNVNGFGYHHQPMPPGSGEMAAAWRPYFETAIEAFGTDRCMFESNFPVDRASFSYHMLWNAFKRVSAKFSPSERAALFHDNAARIYRI